MVHEILNEIQKDLAFGPSPSGKAQDFDSCTRWFESSWPRLTGRKPLNIHLGFRSFYCGRICVQKKERRIYERLLEELYRRPAVL